MPVIVYETNPRDELDGLRDGILAATTGVITRTPNVLNRQWTGFYDGPWPRILISDFLYRLYRISGGKPALYGQDLAKPSEYLVELQDVIAVTNGQPVTGTVGAGQTDVLTLFNAIMAYFEHEPHRCLPDQYGNARADYAACSYQMRSAAPFRESQGGDVTVYKAFLLGVVGLPRKGSLT